MAGTSSLNPGTEIVNEEPANQAVSPMNPGTGVSVRLGRILNDRGLDLDQDGKFDKLVVEVEITSSQSGKYRWSGQLQAGASAVVEQQSTRENTFRADAIIQLVERHPDSQTCI